MNKIKLSTSFVVVTAFLSMAYLSACKKENLNQSSISSSSVKTANQRIQWRWPYGKIGNYVFEVGLRTETCLHHYARICIGDFVPEVSAMGKPNAGMLVGTYELVDDAAPLTLTIQKNMVHPDQQEAIFSKDTWPIDQPFELALKNPEAGNLYIYKVGVDQYQIEKTETDYIVHFHH